MPNIHLITLSHQSDQCYEDQVASKGLYIQVKMHPKFTNIHNMHWAAISWQKN